MILFFLLFCFNVITFTFYVIYYLISTKYIHNVK